MKLYFYLKKMRRLKRGIFFFLAALATTVPTHAVVTRHDVPDASYVVATNAFPALVDLPGGGQGVLIARQWVVTAGHTTLDMPEHGNYVVINGKRRAVSRVVRYPDYLNFSAKWTTLFRGVKSTDATSWMAKYVSVRALMHDIALLQLASPVEDVTPIPLYRHSDEHGKIAKIYGRGVTGNDLKGADPNATSDGKLRRAYNRIVRSDNQLLVYRFDCGADALPLEGVIGDGDSGGPVLVEDAGIWKLAGIAHGLDAQKMDYFTMHAGAYRQGVCGQDFSNARISYFAHWIDSVVGGTQ
ncbi:trypsin-like serine protease [Dyella dinghuensis]|uniref:Trypsin-like serine protease n=1 Tax=Dyella dinghuensis TaxID=1920169 RepID=A0A432LUV0_9GAMM|nr:trypsin-like serine protease [Dyella dinghuensis]RUL65771.1 trypsin-like serine protease [Dyella dinghuensis]